MVAEKPWPELPADCLNEEQMRQWLLPTVYRRLQMAQGAFLAELRPAVALFLRFQGIDYDEDEEAPVKLHRSMDTRRKHPGAHGRQPDPAHDWR